jgi:hypothetical protein
MENSQKMERTTGNARTVDKKRRIQKKNINKI